MFYLNIASELSSVKGLECMCWRCTQWKILCITASYKPTIVQEISQLLTSDESYLGFYWITHCSDRTIFPVTNLPRLYPHLNPNFLDLLHYPLWSLELSSGLFIFCFSPFFWLHYHCFSVISTFLCLCKALWIACVKSCLAFKRQTLLT